MDVNNIVSNFISPTSFIPSFGTIALILLCVVVFFWGYRKMKEWKKQKTRKQIDEQCNSINYSDTIFVSIASYRDQECAQTIFDLFEKAYCPFRIVVGVCQQNYGSDEDVVEAYKRLAQDGIGDFSDKIRVLRMDADEAKGPMYARALIEQKLFRGEKYYFITDSHMLFTPNWDKNIIEEFNICRQTSTKPILTMYPDDFKPHHRSVPMMDYEKANGGYLRFKKFNEKTGIVEIEGPMFIRKPATPVLSLFWAGCFSFGLSSMIKEVPFDPLCEYVFFGEEILMAARLWTSGYDFYHPTTMYCYHMWERNRPTFWQQFNNSSVPLHAERQKREQEGYNRVKKILNMTEDQVTVLPPYGLGTKRSLDQYETFIGIKLKDKKLTALTGVMGLIDNAPAQEILCKFGTWKNFENAKQMIQKSLLK